MTTTKSRVKFIVILGVIAVSFGSIIIKTSKAPSIIIACYRMLFTVLLMTPMVLRNRGSIEEIKYISKKNLLLCLVSGFFLAMHFITWITSLKYTSVNSSTILVNTHPIFIVIISALFLKERYDTKSVMAIGLTLIGGILISWGDFSLGDSQLYGDYLAVFGGFFVSGYILIGNFVRRDISVTAYCYVVYSFSVVFLILAVFIYGYSFFDYPALEYIRFLGLAFVCTILGHTVFNWALAYIRPSFVSLSILGEPVFASLWAIIFFGEVLSYTQLIGSITVLAGIIFYFRITEN